MAEFIDELIAGPNSLGITYDKPKAHDEIDSLIGDERLNQIVQDLVLGLIGGGKGKPIKELMLLMKGKIKGGKMIPSQPFRYGSVIDKPNPSKLDILLNKLKDNPNVGENISNVMKENIKRYNK